MLLQCSKLGTRCDVPIWGVAVLRLILKILKKPSLLLLCHALIYDPDTLELMHSHIDAQACLQVYKPGCGLAFHFDKDETLFKEKQYMTHPTWSSIVYLTGSEDEKPLGELQHKDPYDRPRHH